MKTYSQRFVVIFLLLSIGLIGCKNPLTAVRFVVDSKKVISPRIELQGKRAELKLSGQGFFGARNSAGYLLQLIIQLKVNAKDGDWRVYPDSVCVIFENKPMLQLLYKAPRYSNPLIPKKNYKFDLSFDCRPRLDLSGYDSTKTLEGAELKVVLNHLLYFNGEPVHVDTIYAIDLKAKYYLRQLTTDR
jgi:hypothetical protein